MIEPGQPIFWVPQEETAAMRAVISVATANKRRMDDFIVLNWLVNALYLNVILTQKYVSLLQIYTK